MNLRKPFLYTFTVALALLSATGVLAWTGASTGFPGGNANPPLNVSSAGQIKSGILTTGGLSAPVFCIGTSCISSWASAGGSQWTTNGSSIYYNGGNVGVGTTSPGDKFVVNPDGSNELHVFGEGAGHGTFNGGLVLSNKYKNAYEGAFIKLQQDSPSAALGALALGTSGSTRLFIDNVGNVGIGNTNPGQKLDVSGYIGVRSVNGEGGTIQLQGNNGVTMWLENINGVFRLVNSPWNAQLFSVDQSGNTAMSGAVVAPAFYYSSDERLKKNIAAIASSTALQDILALQPVTFNWIDPNQPTTTQLGFIAQQVEKVVPELVTTNASTTMKAVDYARMTPLLVGAAQAQQAQIDAQNSKIDAQQKEIDALTAEVAALKASR